MHASAAHPAHRIGALARLQPDVLVAAGGGAVLGAVWSHQPVETVVSGLPQHAIALHLGGCTLVEKWADGRLLGHQSRIGSLTLVPAERCTRWVLSGHSRVAHLYVDPQRLSLTAASADGPPCQPALQDFFAADDAPLAALVRRLLLQGAAGTLDLLTQDVCMAAVQRRLLERHAQERPLPPARPAVRLTAATLRRVFAHVDQHFAQPLRLADLAGVACLSDDHFLRAFRAAVGQTPHQYLLARRVQHAQRLLARGPLAMAEVARATGFNSASHFAAMFRQHTGMTPSAWRAQRRR